MLGHSSHVGIVCIPSQKFVNLITGIVEHEVKACRVNAHAGFICLLYRNYALRAKIEVETLQKYCRCVAAILLLFLDYSNRLGQIEN